VTPLGSREPTEGGIPGVEIHIFNGDGTIHQHTTTAADGSYGFSVPAGIYTVCETVPEGFDQTFPTEGADCTGHEPSDRIGPTGHHFEIEEGGRSDGNDFGNGERDGDGCPEVLEACNVTGAKYHDANADGIRQETEAGVPGVEIHIFNGADSVHEHTTTGSDGSYGFLVDPGTYTVCETIPAEPELSNQTEPTAGPDCSEHTGQEDNFGYAVTIEEGTRSEGNDFGNGPDGNCEGATISGTKWDDVNGDGVRDEGEEGVPGVTIVATPETGESCQAVTAEDGSYSMEVAPGTYTVCEVLPDEDGDGVPDREQTFPTEGPDCSEVSGQEGAAGYEVTVADGEESTGNDFGNRVPPLHCSGTANGGHTDGLLLPDTIGQTLWDGGLQIPGLTEDPEHNGILSQPLADLELGLLGTEEIGCLVDLLIDENVSPVDP
jgi:hypothetical protein